MRRPVMEPHKRKAAICTPPLLSDPIQMACGMYSAQAVGIPCENGLTRTPDSCKIHIHHTVLLPAKASHKEADPRPGICKSFVSISICSVCVFNCGFVDTTGSCRVDRTGDKLGVSPSSEVMSSACITLAYHSSFSDLSGVGNSISTLTVMLKSLSICKSQLMPKPPRLSMAVFEKSH